MKKSDYIAQKKSHELLKSLRVKIAKGTATFQERNIIKIIDKNIAKNKPFKIPKP